VKKTCTISVGPSSLRGLPIRVHEFALIKKNTYFSFLAKLSCISKAPQHFATDAGGFCSSKEIILIQLLLNYESAKCYAGYVRIVRSVYQLQNILSRISLYVVAPRKLMYSRPRVFSICYELTIFIFYGSATNADSLQ